MLRRPHGPDISVNAPPRRGVPAVLGLALLEAVRVLDAPRRDALDEHHADLAAKRLGLSHTVSAEISRLERLARRGGMVPGQEFAALQRLVSRRADASLAFADAGRRAARHLGAAMPRGVRALRRVLPAGPAGRMGFRTARRIALRELGVTLDWRESGPSAILGGELAVVTEPGPACSFIGSALAELLRQLAGFDGAMVHTTCRARGAEACAWSATPVPPGNGGGS
jgi:predicted hydrocarbon binding protein